MADFQLDDLPTYMIWRSEPLDDSFDLTAGLNFFPPKGSAELDKALQFWFPLSQTPQERRRDAVIAFLNEEKANSSSEASGPLSSTELDNGTQNSTSASFHPCESVESGPHRSPPTDIIYGPLDECVHHRLPPPAPLDGNVQADYVGPTIRSFPVQQTFPGPSLIDEGYFPPARRSGTLSATLPLPKNCDQYHSVLKISTYGSAERTAHERRLICVDCGKRFLLRKDLPLLETPDYHTSMGAPPSGSIERTEYPTSVDPVSRVTRAQFVQNGYQCKHGGCLKTFNRACDLRHHARKHIAHNDRPCVCLDCGKRFLWQKDLSRHHAQVHTKLRKRPHARLPRQFNVSSNCSARFHTPVACECLARGFDLVCPKIELSRLSDLSRHQRCIHDSSSVRVDDDSSQLPGRNDPSHQQGSMAIASRDRPFPHGHSGKPLLWEKHMSQALRQTTKTSLRRLDSTLDRHGSIPELSIASRHEPFHIRGLLVVVLSSPGLWMVESVALLLCFVFGVTYPGFVEQFLKVVLLSLCRK